MTRAFVAMGSNIEPEKNIREAIRMLSRLTDVLKISTVYRTKALGRPGQPDYYNCVVEIEAALDPIDLKRKVLGGIEEWLGRVRTEDKYAPRTIDLDLIAYGYMAMDSQELTLPDPDIMKRPFLAAALRDLDPELKMPGWNQEIGEIAKSMSHAGMETLADYTELLRRENRERDKR